MPNTSRRDSRTTTNTDRSRLRQSTTIYKKTAHTLLGSNAKFMTASVSVESSPTLTICQMVSRWTTRKTTWSTNYRRAESYEAIANAASGGPSASRGNDVSSCRVEDNCIEWKPEVECRRRSGEKGIHGIFSKVTLANVCRLS